MFERVSDSGKVLAFVEAANEKEFDLNEEYIDTYVYLMKAQHNIPFNYSFVWHPLPYSNDLRQDMMGLNMAGYLKSGSIRVTPKGKKWIKERQSSLPEFGNLLDRIRSIISSFRLYDSQTLSDAVYARIV